MITLGQILDLIDASRESEEMINIICGQLEVKTMICISFWHGMENRPVRRIRAEGSELYIWLEDLNDDD